MITSGEVRWGRRRPLGLAAHPAASGGPADRSHHSDHSDHWHSGPDLSAAGRRRRSTWSCSSGRHTVTRTRTRTRTPPPPTTRTLRVGRSGSGRLRGGRLQLPVTVAATGTVTAIEPPTAAGQPRVSAAQVQTNLKKHKHKPSAHNTSVQSFSYCCLIKAVDERAHRFASRNLRRAFRLPVRQSAALPLRLSSAGRVAESLRRSPSASQASTQQFNQSTFNDENKLEAVHFLPRRTASEQGCWAWPWAADNDIDCGSEKHATRKCMA